MRFVVEAGGPRRWACYLKGDCHADARHPAATDPRGDPRCCRKGPDPHLAARRWIWDVRRVVLPVQDDGAMSALSPRLRTADRRLAPRWRCHKSGLRKRIKGNFNEGVTPIPKPISSAP